MALWICEGCTTKYAVGLFCCPRCHSTDFHEEDSMPKISRAAGATNGLPEEAVVETVETVEPEAPVVEPDVEPETLAPEPEPEAASEPEAEPEAEPEPAPVKRTRARAAKPAEDTTEPDPEAEE